MKKFITMLLCSVMVLSLTACSTTEPVEETPSQSYTAGTYTAVAKGMKGEIQVEVTFGESSIDDVKVVSQTETYGVGYGMDTTPVEVIPGRIVELQGLGVDTVTGATITSNAIINAVADAATQAGADAEALKAITAKGEVTDETYDVDVVVVGAGAAGLAAGIGALEVDSDANVLILEKQGLIGGATTLSGGKIMAAGTTWQEKQGQVDNPQMMFDYLKEIGGELIDDAKVMEFCENSVKTLSWVEDMGVKVINVEPIHKSITPLRVHNTETGGGMTNGIGGQISVPMYNAYVKNGGNVEYDVTVDTILMNDAGEAVGVTGTRPDGSKVTVNAKSVVIATGGYAQNKEFLAKTRNGYAANAVSSVPKGNLGDGIAMAEKVGGQIFWNDDAQVVYLSFTTGVGINEEDGLIVSDKAQRVVNEFTYQYNVGKALTDADSATAYYIFTKNDPNPYVQYAMSLESTPHAASIEELATQIGLDATALKATVDRYNELAAKGVDEDFGKPAERMYPIEGEMYYALKFNTNITVTYSGIVTDIDGHVLNENNEVIKGLYAAGETAFPGLFGGEYPGCGMAIGGAIYYGREAGSNAVQGL